MKHIFEKCEATKIEGANWKSILNGKKSNYHYLNSIIWKRKEIEKKER